MTNQINAGAFSKWVHMPVLWQQNNPNQKQTKYNWIKQIKIIIKIKSTEKWVDMPVLWKQK